MQAYKAETVTNALVTILGSTVLALMHATRNPVLIRQVVDMSINVVLKKEKENAPTTKDKGGD